MSDIIQASAAFFEKELQLPDAKEYTGEVELINLLVPIIKRMLDREFEKLLSFCYRIDLGENKLKTILHESAPDSMANELATALVKRQIQKLEIRQKYRDL
jgi:hypothetical protein